MPPLPTTSLPGFDIFPLAEGRVYAYSYFAASSHFDQQSLSGSAVADSGRVTYLIEHGDSLYGGKVIWMVQAHDSLVHSTSYSYLDYLHGGVVTTKTYSLIDSTYMFLLTESLMDTNHEISTSSLVWNFPLPVHRYSDTADVVMVRYSDDSFVRQTDTLCFRRNEGFWKRRLYGGHVGMSMWSYGQSVDLAGSVSMAASRAVAVRKR
ncbi:MAG TPA: hypothetical protein VK569_11230 [Bacteroidota bacterium]|nr:hypothetical protein [Bacteroidota bacterium]